MKLQTQCVDPRNDRYHLRVFGGGFAKIAAVLFCCLKWPNLLCCELKPKPFYFRLSEITFLQVEAQIIIIQFFKHLVPWLMCSNSDTLLTVIKSLKTQNVF